MSLDLSFLATGGRQHVFVRSDGGDDWVYKVPAAFGYILPVRHRFAARRIRSWKGLLYRAIVVWPHQVRVRLGNPVLRWLRRWDPATRPLVVAAVALGKLVRRLRDRLLMAQQRRARAEDFATMLDVLEQLERAGLDSLLPPYRILRDATATLRIGETTLAYRGPMLAQRRVDRFFTKDAPPPIAPQDLVGALHSLWRHRFALLEVGENLGYRSWALVDGQLRLADTSALTRDVGRGRRALRAASLDAQQRLVLQAQTTPEAARAFERFFESLRQEIHEEALTRLWNAAGTPSAGQEQSTPPATAQPPGPAGAKEESLTQRTLAGLIWTGLGKGALAIIDVVVLFALARLLTPTDFGTVSAALVIVRFSFIVSRLGFGPALVQAPALEARHIETAFLTSIGLGLGIGAIVWGLSPFTASFFRTPQVMPVLQALALSFPIRGFTIVAEALVRRELRFRWLAQLEVKTFALGYGPVGIGLAALGAGPWALVGAHLAQSTLRAALLLTAIRPPQRLRIDRSAFKELVYFGGGFTAGKLANSFAQEADYIVVGRWLGPAALGLYTRAYKLMAAGASLLGGMLDDVLFPSMARVQGDAKRLRIAYRRGAALIALATLPATALFIALAPEIVRVALGPQWDEAVVPFQILAAGFLFRTGYKIGDSLARATGHIYRRAWRQVVYAAAVFGGAWLGLPWGLTGVATGVAIAITLNFLLMTHLSVSITGIEIPVLVRVHAPPALLAAAIGLPAWGLAEWLRSLGMSSLPTLLIVGGAASAIGLLLVKLFHHQLLGADGVWMLEAGRRAIADRRRRGTKAAAESIASPAGDADVGTANAIG